MKPPSRGQSCCRAGPSASNKTAAGISCLLDAFSDSNNSFLTHNRSPSQTPSSAHDANDNAATSRLRRGVVQPIRRQFRSGGRTTVRSCDLGNRRGVSSACVVRNQSRREVVRQKQRGRHLATEHRRALQTDKSYRAVSRTPINKSRNKSVQPSLNSRTARLPVTAGTKGHGRCTDKNKAGNRHSSAESNSSSVSRYKLVYKPKHSEGLYPVSSCNSRRCRPNMDSFNDSHRRRREHHRHTNRSSNRRPDESRSSSRSNASQCCQYRDRSPLQSPLRSSTPNRQDSTMKFKHRSKHCRGHYTKNGNNRSSSNSESSSNSDIGTVDRDRHEKMRDGNRKCKRGRKRRSFFACVLM